MSVPVLKLDEQPPKRRIAPFLVLVGISLVLLVASVVIAVKQQRSITDLGVFEDQDLLASSLRESITSGHPRAWPLIIVAGLTPLVLLTGLALLILFAMRMMRGKLLESEWRHEPNWTPLDVVNVGIAVVAIGWLASYLLRGRGAQETCVAQLAVHVMMAAGVILVIIVGRGGTFAAMGMRRHRFFRNVGTGLAACISFLPVFTVLVLSEAALLTRFGIRMIPQEPVQIMYMSRSPLALVALSTLAVIVAPVAEELFFRSFLQGALRRTSGARLAILGTALFFAASHVNIFAFLPLLAMGLILGYVYDRTQSLAAPVALHSLYNACIVSAVAAVRLALG